MARRRRRKTRSRPRALLEYIVLIAIVWFVRILPERLALWLGRTYGRLSWYLHPRYRSVALGNLKHVYGDEMTDDERGELVRRVMMNLGLTFVETQRLPNMLRRSDIAEHVTIDAPPEALEALRSGAVLVTGHLGNWEVAGVAVSHLITPLHSIAKRTKNPLVDKYLRDVRENLGHKILYRSDGMRPVVSLLKNGHSVAFVSDQDVRHEGVIVEFLGRPASTTPAPVGLGQRLGVPVVPGYCLREAPGRWRLIAEKPLDLVETGNRQRDLVENAAKMNDVIGGWIREHPDQWFGWIHRRWKTTTIRRKAKRERYQKQLDNNENEQCPTVSQTS
jgi:KDO2-lipid IV(A) lauroyltransferase